MKKVLSIFLTTLLLASSSGIAYAQHFCGEFEMIATVTLGEEHLSCGMKMLASGCDDEDLEDHECCSNSYTQVDTDEDFAKASFETNLDVHFVAAFVSVFVLQQLEYELPSAPGFRDYHPPPLEKDLPVLYQVFLI